MTNNISQMTSNNGNMEIKQLKAPDEHLSVLFYGMYFLRRPIYPAIHLRTSQRSHALGASGDS